MEVIWSDAHWDGDGGEGYYARHWVTVQAILRHPDGEETEHEWFVSNMRQARELLHELYLGDPLGVYLP